MEETKRSLTTEEAMRQAGLERVVNDDVARELLSLGDKVFDKVYFCWRRQTEAMIKFLSGINPEGLSRELQEWHYSTTNRTVAELENLELVKEKRVAYRALAGVV